MSGEIISFGKAVVDALNENEQPESVCDDVAELRRLGIELECRSATLTAVAQRVEAKQAGFSEFAIAEANYEFARDCFREQLGAVTGKSAAWVERLLAL